MNNFYLSDEISFNPIDVPNLLAWWSASENVLNASAAGAVDDDPVATWTDKVNGRTFTQSTSGNRPVYKTGIVNGLPVVRFDGTDDRLEGDATARAFTQNKATLTIMMVGSYRAFKAGATSYAFGSTVGGSTAARVAMGAGANSAGSTSRRAVGRALDADSATEIATSPTLYPTGFEVMALQQDWGNKRGRLLRNGVQILANTTYTNMTAGNTSNITSQAFTIGSISGVSPAEYDAGELLVFDGLVSDDDITALSQYFSTLYAIS